MKKLTASLLMSAFPYCAFAGVFTADITVTNPDDGISQTKAFDFDQANNFFDQLKNKGFQREFQGYDSTWAVQANTIYQGVPINVSLQENSNNLILNIPNIGVTKVFDGSSRNDTTKALENYLRNDVDGTYSKIVEYQVASTPNSQLAGNPSSLQGQLLSNSFSNATNISSTTNTSSSRSSNTSSNHSTLSSANPIVVGVAGGTYVQRSAAGKSVDVSIISVPISKAFSIDSDDPRKQLLVNGQFNYITVGQASSFQGSLGLGYKHPITDNWSLIPSVSYGAIGSQDLASLGQVFSASIASNYRFNVGEYDTTLVNLFGYYKTLPLSINGLISSDPNINNYVLKNGIMPSHILPFKVFSHDVKAKAIFTDTEFFGSTVFISQYNEVGMEFSTINKVDWLNKATFGLADSLSLSAKYVFSIQDPNRFEGYDIGLSYDF
jgi:hypothetical protein